jgi:hypothetical protein
MAPPARAGGTLKASLAGSGIALRPAASADAEFCYQLHKAAMGEYITAIWGWDEQVQRAFHQRAFNPDRWQIITAGQAGTGILDVVGTGGIAATAGDGLSTLPNALASLRRGGAEELDPARHDQRTRPPMPNSER